LIRKRIVVGSRQLFPLGGAGEQVTCPPKTDPTLMIGLGKGDRSANSPIKEFITSSTSPAVVWVISMESEYFAFARKFNFHLW
jgi:hypothetical protein